MFKRDHTLPEIQVKSLALVLALALLAPAPAIVAQAPAPPPARGPVSLPGISPAGNAVIQRLQRQPDPQGQALVREQQAFGQRMIAILNAPVVDVDRIGAAMREGQTLQARGRALTDARLLSILRALPAADRKPFLRLVLAGGQQQRAPGR